MVLVSGCTSNPDTNSEIHTTTSATIAPATQTDYSKYAYGGITLGDKYDDIKDKLQDCYIVDGDALYKKIGNAIVYFESKEGADSEFDYIRGFRVISDEYMGLTVDKSTKQDVINKYGKPNIDEKYDLISIGVYDGKNISENGWVLYKFDNVSMAVYFKNEVVVSIDTILNH